MSFTNMTQASTTTYVQRIPPLAHGNAPALLYNSPIKNVAQFGYILSTLLEAPTGIEPVYAVLQTAASPLRQGAAKV